MKWTDSFFLKCLPVFVILVGLWLYSGQVAGKSGFAAIGWVIVSIVYILPIMTAVLLIGFVIDLMRFFERRKAQSTPKSSKLSKIILVIVLTILAVLTYRLYPHLLF